MSGEGAQLPCALMVGAVTLCSWALSSSYRAQLPTDFFYFLFFFVFVFFFKEGTFLLSSSLIKQKTIL